MPDIPFATVDELRDRWPTMPAGSDDYAKTLLEDASQFIVDTVPQAVNASPATLRRITCAVVRRYMEQEDTGLGSYSNMQTTTGPFSQSMSPVSPGGGFWLKIDEKRALGWRKQSAYSISAFGRGDTHGLSCALRFGAAYCSCMSDINNGDGPLYGGRP